MLKSNQTPRHKSTYKFAYVDFFCGTNLDPQILSPSHLLRRIFRILLKPRHSFACDKKLAHVVVSSRTPWSATMKWRRKDQHLTADSLTSHTTATSAWKGSHSIVRWVGSSPEQITKQLEHISTCGTHQRSTPARLKEPLPAALASRSLEWHTIIHRMVLVQMPRACHKVIIALIRKTLIRG